MIECSSSTAIAPKSKRALWRQTGGFCEVKPTPEQGPKSKDPKVVKPLVCQAADFMLVFISPLDLFSSSQSGSSFSVLNFVSLSSTVPEFYSLPLTICGRTPEIFVRVIRSLTCHSSSVELGQDPTVITLLINSTNMEKLNKGFGSRATQRSPDVRDYDGRSGSPSWHTIGLPIWTSVSFLGRGTSVWLVQENGAGTVLVLKNT